MELPRKIQRYKLSYFFVPICGGMAPLFLFLLFKSELISVISLCGEF